MPRHHRPRPPKPTPAPAPTPAPTPVVPSVHLRGTNLCGMEGGYDFADNSHGPIAGHDYPVHSTKLIDYFKSKGITILRFLFSWERMTDSLYGPVPKPWGVGAGYVEYFNNYKRIVDYATSHGITVIMEPWQASVNGDTGGATWRGQLLGSVVDLYAFADFWGKMATIFKDNPLVHYGLVNEPNNMSTMTWFTVAQKCIDYIRNAGAKTPIYVPGNGWTGASTWKTSSAWYDSATPQRDNAYGWLNANGLGSPLWDPLHNLVAEVHCYADPNAGGGTTDIASPTVIGDRLKDAVTEARAHGYKVFVGELGFYAGATQARTLWTNTLAYVNANPDVIVGYTWWAAGSPGWWDDVAAHGGGHFSITPTNGTTFTGDTVNMTMIAGGFV